MIKTLGPSWFLYPGMDDATQLEKDCDVFYILYMIYSDHSLSLQGSL